MMRDSTANVRHVLPMSRRFFSLTVLALCAAALVSCASMQDDNLISVDDQTLVDRLTELEEDTVRIDALAGKERASAIEAARAKVANLERLNAGDTVFQARLLAWSGRLYLAAGRRNDALKRHDAAMRLLPSDVPSSILGARLAKNDESGIQLIDQALLVELGDPRLLVERALFAERLGRYSESVASFDSALPRLPPWYRETYRIVRDRAWELRDTDSGESGEITGILGAASVTWQDTVTWCLVKTNLMDFATAGKTATAQKLFPKLVAAGVIPPREDGTAANAANRVSRAETAWFVWHALAENRADQAMLTKYSRRWSSAAGNASPIPDVTVTSVYFDSVMGCVESEIMALPDGINFQPQNGVSGTDMARITEKAGR